MVTESTISLSPASHHRWGVFWLSVIFIFVPWRLLGSFFWAYLRGVPGSRRGYVGVAPATWGSAQDLGPSFCPWGALWFSVVLIPWRLLCSVVFGYSWGVFILLLPFFSSSWGPSSSSSPSGIMVAKGYSSWPPILGGSSSLAIPPSVTREVQDVSSLVAPPLAIVRALPLTINSHPSLLGSSRDVSGGAAFPPLHPLGLFLHYRYCKCSCAPGHDH